ncbi:Peroxisomal membrane protein [Aspergillus sclerotialis]|uniref:Peroxisomal membrane protein n=1 Tax=Aspergillus sclerotialis TaxID=2070753 RepID=A0A3A2ZJM6_9EURO|nr:Peroxisomal membrane protein [Aspergillus sclerotialis]
MDALMSRLDTFVTNPDFAPVLSLVKGVRNGVVYGSKVRFPHALVMIFLFRSGTFREKVKLVLKATRQHARNLATFAFIYKSSMIVLRNLNMAQAGKEGRYDSFIAGLLGGYVVFGRNRGSVSKQIVIYVFARVMLSLAQLAIEPRANPLSSVIPQETRTNISNNAYPAFAALSWAFVMYLFRWYPDTLISSLRSSMVYIYSDSDHWDSFRNFLIHNK